MNWITALISKLTQRILTFKPYNFISLSRCSVTWKHFPLSSVSTVHCCLNQSLHVQIQLVLLEVSGHPQGHKPTPETFTFSLGQLAKYLNPKIVLTWYPLWSLKIGAIYSRQHSWLTYWGPSWMREGTYVFISIHCRSFLNLKEKWNTLV